MQSYEGDRNLCRPIEGSGADSEVWPPYMGELLERDKKIY
jgi:hypothetical protein